MSEKPVFIPLVQEARDDSGQPHRISIFCINEESPLEDPRAEDALFQAIDGRVRIQDRTVIVDVHLPEVPAFVVAAIRRFAHSGDPIVGLHRRQCSLDSTYTHTHDFFEAARVAAGRYGTLWHPIKLSYVHRNPIGKY